MAKKLSILKRIRQNEKGKQHNKSFKSAMKTQIKKLLGCMQADDVTKTKVEFQKTVAILDRIGRKNILHKNNTDRKKSKLHQKYNQYLATQKQKAPTTPDPQPAS